MDYKTRLQKSLKKEEAEAMDIAYAAESAALQIQADILATKKAVGEQQRKVDTLKCAKDFSAKAIIEAADELVGRQKGLAVLEALKAELFPDQK